jgi:CelD/BcsL family acetyltransferase involved in cellulose biosynthesis
LDAAARLLRLTGGSSPSAAETVADAVASSASAIRTASSLADVGLTADGWNALAAKGTMNSVFQTHEWARSWLAAFGDEYEPMVIVASDNDQIGGVAPLVIDRRQGDRIVRFIGDGRSDYCDFLGPRDNPGIVTALVDKVFADDRWNIIELNNIPEHSPTADIVRRRSARHGYPVLTNEMYVCPTLLVAGHSDAARAIVEKPSLRRRENYLRRRGRLVCRDLKTQAEITPYLERFFEQHIQRWIAAGRGPSLFVNDRNRAFYRHLTESVAARGWLLFSVIEFDDQPIAFHFGFDYDSTVTWYKPSFNVKFAAASPGLVLVQHLIRYAIEQDRRELDFTVGDEPFKRRFTNHARRTVSVRVFRDRFRFLRERSRRAVSSAFKSLSSTGASLCSIGSVGSMGSMGSIG